MFHRLAAVLIFIIIQVTLYGHADAATPTVTTLAPTLVTSSSVTFNGSADPNGDSSYGFFRYSTTNPGTCSDSFGSRWPTSGGTSLGSGSSPVAYARTRIGLSPGTTYYYCALAYNSYGTSWGSVQSFTTDVAAPVVSTSSATLLTGTTAQLNGSANPGGASTTGWFRYDTSSPGSCNDSFGTRAPSSSGSALGSGTSSVAYSEGITGLSVGMTYYFCAITQNSVGMSFGTIRSFTTPSPPTAVTNAATSVGNTSATLQGEGTPNGSSTTGWYRYSPSDPGTCDDSFGTRAPTTGGSSLGSGTSPVSYNRSISGLSTDTTYYYCAIVSSAEGTGFGAVLAFTTADAPTVTTSAPTLVTSSSVTFNGSADPNGNSSYGFFRYSTTNPGTCSDSFGSRWPTSGGTSLGSGSSPVAYARTRIGLSPGTTYYYCALAYNSYGTSWGSVQSFTTDVAAPVVSTSSATLLTGTTAQLNGSANPGGASTTGWFRYDTSSPGSCNDSFGTRAPSSSGSALGSGTSSVAYSEGITGLSVGMTYYFCAIAQNSAGMSFGTIRSFTTPSPPTAVTNAATSVGNTSATLQGEGTPNGSSTTGWYRYSPSDPGTCDDSFGTRAPTTGGSSLGSGTSPVSYNRSISGLSTDTTYYYCAIVSSAEGTGFGAVLAFTTADAPTVTTSAPTLVTSSSVTFNGSADPNGNSSYGFFRYSTTNPGTCSDSFGSRWPTSGGTSLGSGSSPVAYARTRIGLSPGTTYYYCALAYNSYGTSWGSVQSLTTLAALPVVSTSSATLLTLSSAQLNGLANPGGGSTTGWFRYDTSSPGSCNDSFGARAPSSSGSALGSGISSVAFSEGITGLTAGTAYYYCAIAQNSEGLGFGSVVSFMTRQDSDGDGFFDSDDAFPNDPAASVDTDGDGYPDSWNPGKTQGDSTTGLSLDVYPIDPSENTDTDGDGLGDNADAFPSDPTETVDCDRDGIGDNADTSKFCMPTTLNYQGFLTDNTGAAITGTPIIIFRLYDVETGGTPQWEASIPVTVNNGVYSIALGESPSPAINPAMFSKQLFLGVQVQGEASEMIPRQKLAAVPYAMRAGSVEQGGMPIVKDGNGSIIGTLVYGGESFLGIISANGYIFEVSPGSGSLGQVVKYASADCSGTAYVGMPQSVQFDGTNYLYTPKAAVAFNITTNSMKASSDGWICQGVTSSDGFLYPLQPNDPTITDAPSAPVVIPLQW